MDAYDNKLSTKAPNTDKSLNIYYFRRLMATQTVSGVKF